MKSSSRGEQFIVSVVFFLIGLGMLIGGSYLGWRNQQSLVGKVRVKAVVTNVITNESGPDSSMEYFPTVAFTTADGEYIQSTPATYRETSAMGGLVTVDLSDDGYETAYAVGDEVEVFYDPGNPTEVILNDFNMLWVAPLVVGGLGACFMPLGGLLGIVALVRAWRRSSNTQNSHA